MAAHAAGGPGGIDALALRALSGPPGPPILESVLLARWRLAVDGSGSGWPRSSSPAPGATGPTNARQAHHDRSRSRFGNQLPERGRGPCDSLRPRALAAARRRRRCRGRARGRGHRLPLDRPLRGPVRRDDRNAPRRTRRNGGHGGSERQAGDDPAAPDQEASLAVSPGSRTPPPTVWGGVGQAIGRPGGDTRGRRVHQPRVPLTAGRHSSDAVEACDQATATAEPLEAAASIC